MTAAPTHDRTLHLTRYTGRRTARRARLAALATSAFADRVSSALHSAEASSPLNGDTREQGREGAAGRRPPRLARLSTYLFGDVREHRAPDEDGTAHGLAESAPCPGGWLLAPPGQPRRHARPRRASLPVTDDQVGGVA